jgi:ribosomal protein S18 acetylase RimI-like enzyme
MVTTPVSMQILPDTPAHRNVVNAVLQAAADYNLLVEGVPPTAVHVEEFFTSVPPGYTVDDLFPLGFFAGQEPIGVGGVLRRWNTPNKAIIGLLVFVPAWRGSGMGRAAVEHIEALARNWAGIDRLRVAVLVNNVDALAFWRKVGFADTGEVKPKYAAYVDDIVIFEKSI